MNYEFRLNGELLDVQDLLQFPFTLSKNVFIRGGLGRSKGVSSKTCIFPPTENNFKIFDKNNEYDNNNKFYTLLKYELIINIEGQNLFKGSFNITKYSKKKGIEGFFISYLSDWVSDIQGKSLRDIQTFEGVEFKGATTIELLNLDMLFLGSRYNQKHDICFPLITYGTYFLPYWPKRTKYIDFTDYSSIVDNPLELIDGFKLTNSDIPNLTFQDIPPSYFVANIFKKIFQDIGYSVAGSWINSEQVSQMILPTIREGLVEYNWGFLAFAAMDNNFNTFTLSNTTWDETYFVSAFQQYGYFYLVRRLANLPSNNFFDYSHNIANKYIYGDYFVPVDGRYEIEIHIIGESRTNDMNLLALGGPQVGFFYAFTDSNDSEVDYSNDTSRWIVDINGVPGWFQIPYPSVINTWEFFDITKTFQTDLKRNDLLRFMQIYLLALNIFDVRYTEFYFTIKNISGDQEFQIAKNLPDMSQTEFIQSIIRQENLYYDVDATKKVIYFEKRDNFYLQSDVATDITEFTDETNGEIVPNEVPEKYIFSYQFDSDDFLELENTFEVPTIYQLKTDNEEVESYFSKTGLTEFTIVENTLPPTAVNLQTPNFNQLSKVDLPIIADSDRFNSLQYPDGTDKYEGWSYNYVPRILQLNGFHDFSLGAANGIPLRKWDYTLNQDVISRPVFMPAAYFEPLEWSNLILNWNSFLFLIQHSHYINIPIKINVKLWNEIKSNVPIKIKQNNYILQNIGDFKILEKNTIVEITLLKLL